MATSATAFGVAYIAYKGVSGSTAVNIAINVIQISALLVFSVMALGYRMNHPPGSQAWQFDSTSGDAYTYEFMTEKAPGPDGKPAAVTLTLGLSDGASTEVLRGDVREGQEVIVGSAGAGGRGAQPTQGAPRLRL